MLTAYRKEKEKPMTEEKKEEKKASEEKKGRKKKEKKATAYDKLNYTAKTFFLMIPRQSLVNMGMDMTEWDKGDEEWELDRVKETLFSMLQEIGGMHYGTICKSKKDFLHIHDVVTFKKPMRMLAVAKLFGHCHTEEMRGTKEQAADYINSRGLWESKEEDVLAEYGDLTAIQNNQGKRTDLEEFIKAVQNGEIVNVDRYLYQHPEMAGRANMLKGIFSRNLKYTVASKFREVKVHYVEGVSRSGKSVRVSQLYENANDFMDNVFRIDGSEKTNFPFNGYEGQKKLWIDELRPGMMKANELLQILDGYPLSVNVKGGQSWAAWDEVYITTACGLSEWYRTKEDTSEETKARFDNLRDQFLNRITNHIFAIHGTWWKVPVRDKNGDVPVLVDEEKQEDIDTIYNLAYALSDDEERIDGSKIVEIVNANRDKMVWKNEQEAVKEKVGDFEEVLTKVKGEVEQRAREREAKAVEKERAIKKAKEEADKRKTAIFPNACQYKYNKVFMRPCKKCPHYNDCKAPEKREID